MVSLGANIRINNITKETQKNQYFRLRELMK